MMYDLLSIMLSISDVVYTVAHHENMAIAPLAIAALVAGAAKIIGGGIQAGKAAMNLKKKAPDYDIHGEFAQNQNIAKRVSNMGGMPEVQRNAAMQALFRNSNFGVQQLQGRRAAVAGIGNVVQRMNDGSNAIGIADANMALQNRRIGAGMEMQANMAMAQQRMAKDKWEKYDPYMRKYLRNQAMLGAGLQNIFGGLTNIASMGGGMMGGMGGNGGGISVPSQGQMSSAASMDGGMIPNF